MKRLIACALALFSAAAFGVTYTPISTLQPAGSTSGQVITSTGSSSGPTWGNVSAAALTGIVPVANGGTGVTTAAGELSRISAAPLANPTFTGTVIAPVLQLIEPSNNTNTLQITNTGANGANIRLIGNGATTPNKTIRVNAGLFQILNSAYSSPVLAISDTGSTNLYGNLNVGYANASIAINDTSASNKAALNYYKNNVLGWALSNSSSANTLAIDRFVSGTYVDSPIAVSNSTGVSSFSQRPVFSGNTPWDSGNLTIANYAPLASPGLTGTPTTPTAVLHSSTTQIASTGFVINELSSPPAIGVTAPNTGAFTSLSATGTVTGFTGRLLNVRVFSTSGTYTPTTGTAAVYVKVQAGGGAGGGTPVTNASQAAAGSGGGAGSYAEGYYTTGFSGVTVTVGGSASGVSGAVGTVGNTSSFGSLISCPGGNGGLLGNAATASFSTASPSNASACTGTVLFGETGTAGDESIVISSTVSSSGRGGSSIFGPGAPQRWSVGAGIGTSKYGAGGSGANASVSTAAQAGGNSAQGIVEVFEFSQ